MEHFAQLKRRTTDLLQSLPESLSPTKAHHGAAIADVHTMKGTWQRIAIPSLPRSSHSIDVVSGTAYVFGGEGALVRHPVDNDMHALVLPTGSAAADYYAIKAVAAKKSVAAAAPVLTISEPPPESDPVVISEPQTVTEGDSSAAAGASADGADEASNGKGKDREDVVEDVPLPGPPLGDVPAPRVGHATAVIGNRIFVFGGRGGPDMAALEERGRVWVFDTKTHTWSYLDPLAPAVPVPIQAVPETGGATMAPAASGTTRPIFPASRSYHAAAATDQPGPKPSGSSRFNRPRRAASWKEWAEGDMAEVGTPQRPIVGNVAAHARDADSEGFGTFLIHGGCLADGTRANDLWAFDVRTRVWQELPAAPGLPRGGTSIALSRSRLYRFGGFNGSSEEGGRLDYLQLGLTSLDDTSAEEAEITVTARGGWQSLVAENNPAAASAHAKKSSGAEGKYEPVAASEGGEDAVAPSGPRGATDAAPLVAGVDAGSAWPGNRSVSSLEAVSTGGGWEYLVLALGERSPSGSGHEAAGTFWNDVWALQVPSDGLSAASVSHAVRNVLPRRWFGGSAGAGEGQWSRVVTAPYDEDDAQADGGSYGPEARGWIASSPLRELEENGIVIFGGLNESNQRLGDAWIFRLGGETRE
ncbi:kelch repeat protein [Niveomyces insectorum RCEF 264]|uniref:Kelch repeat protein n=1 Tax=Niveomyces insectorum RCEF 264 TaxID=1081102 RepID=A0A162JG89_9HYPO|nr:kelch repeat protein [Niveomyces insectorum RCEF 264]